MTPGPGFPVEPDPGAAVGALVKVERVDVNAGQSAFVTTRDKARGILMEHQARIRGHREWVGPAGILVTVALALLTTDFQSRWHASGDAWKTVFVLLALASAGWLVYLGVRAARGDRAWTPDEIVDRLAGTTRHGDGADPPAGHAAALAGAREGPAPDDSGTGAPGPAPTGPAVGSRAPAGPAAVPGSPPARARSRPVGEGRARLGAGATVDHPDFGRGVVVDIVPENGSNVAVVRFDDRRHGMRRISLERSRMTVTATDGPRPVDVPPCPPPVV